jgi:PAS domain S-box-containing protein
MSALNVHDDSIQFEIYDGNQKTEENLLYRSFTPSASLPTYHHDEVIRLGTRTWHLYYFSTPLFEQEHTSQYPVLFGLIGLSLYFLLLYIIVELMRSQKKLRLKSIEAESGRRWLEALLESSIDGIHILDINGKLIHYSPSFLNMIGRTAEDADDLYVFDWDHLHTREEVLQHLGSITEEPSIFESQHHRKDGSIVDVEIIARQIILGKERYIYAASRDISERKISENELRLEKETAQHYLDIVNVMIMVLDVNKNVKLINRRGCEILGYTPDEIIGKNFVDNFLPVDIHAEIEEVQEALIKSEPYGIYYENPVLSKSGEERLIAWRNSSLFDLDGNFIGILTSGEDITQIRKAQKLLSESEHFYRTIVASVNESILILEKNKIIDCNDLAVELFQTAKDRLIGKNILDFSKNFECGVHNFDFHLNTAYQEGLHLMECSLVLNLEKESKVIEISLTSFGADDDKLIMIARDITQKIENDKLFKMQARQAQMGEMISMIAHQWRQPLAIINAITSQMRLKTMMSETEDPILIENLIKIEEQSLHLSQTISEYRDFFRPDKPKETFYLSVLLKNAIHLVDHAIKNQSIDLQLLLHEDTKLTTFRNEVLQVLIALLKNALDAFDENKVENKKILIEVVEDEKFGVIAIVDNAGGIAPDIIGKIFRPYFTTKNQIHGTGLGLYMSKMIIEEHCSGRINVSSEGLETTFIIKLPK